MRKKKFHQLKIEQWDKFNYNVWFNTPKGKLIDKLEKSAVRQALKFIGSGKRNVLDFGIGNGRLIPVYVKYCSKLVGIDISSKQLEELNKTFKFENDKNVGLVRADEHYLKLENSGKYDLIICTRTLQHVENQERTFQELMRLLNNSGYLLLMTYNRYSYYGLRKVLQNRYQDKSKGRFLDYSKIHYWASKYDGNIIYEAGSMILPPELCEDQLKNIERFEPLMKGVEWVPYANRLVFLIQKNKKRPAGRGGN